MKYLVYISAAHHLFNEDELLDILVVSRKNNLTNNLTGMLLYGEGTFIQVLEGETAMLESVYRTILSDTRHKDVIKLMEGDIVERHFPDWTMGFRSTNASELAEMGMFVDPRQPGFLQEGSAPVMKILKSFVQSNRMNG